MMLEFRSNALDWGSFNNRFLWRILQVLQEELS